jgi:hypothetical protein
MIEQGKMNNALYALHLILVRARFMSYHKEAHEDIAMILDSAEELPRLIAVEDDMTEAFRNSLVGLAARYPSCSNALTAFDQVSVPDRW